jgi:hypothetical protein
MKQAAVSTPPGSHPAASTPAWLYLVLHQPSPLPGLTLTVGNPWMLFILHILALALSSQSTAATSARPLSVLATFTYCGARA